METMLIIANVYTDKIVKKLSVVGNVEDWQKTIILNDFCELNDLNYKNYKIYSI